jgi:retron-type reverse transcriptase
VKRAGNLLEAIAERENLRLAAFKALRGKRAKADARRYLEKIETNLRQLGEQIRTNAVPLGRCRQFTIHDPKERLITAPCFEERVLHHAIMNVCEPIFDRWLLPDTYACRRDKGTHAAVDRCQEFARRFRYVLKADVQKFFPSLDHEIAKELVARKIKDPDVLWLVGQIIDHSNPQEEVLNYFPGDNLFTPAERRRGIPIGNQTSQFFANVYLDPLDHFVKDRLGIKGYVRYVDDFLVFSDDKSYLADVREQIREFLVRLRLRLHPKKSVVFPVKSGIRFLGYRAFPTHRLLPKENVRRFRRRVRGMQEDYATGRVSYAEIYLSIPKIPLWQAGSYTGALIGGKLPAPNFRRSVLTAS